MYRYNNCRCEDGGMEFGMNQKVIVIGAGVAGLTAAIYARRSGFDVTLIEQHGIVGGMCTSWKRKGYLFEGAVHWLTGSNPKVGVHQIWKETGALRGDVPVLLQDPFRSVEWDGQILNMYRDIDKTVDALAKISPADARLLRRVAGDVRAVCGMQMPVMDVKGVTSERPNRMSPGFMLKMLPALPAMIKYSKISCAELTAKFSHPGIRRLFSVVPDEYAANSLIFTLATLHIGDGGCPAGGSLPMTRRMSDTFTDMGGTLMLNTRVRRVNVENGRVTGVTLAAGAKATGAQAGAWAGVRAEAFGKPHMAGAQTAAQFEADGAGDVTLDADAVIVTQDTAAAPDALFDVPPTDAWLLDLRKTVKPAVCTFISIGVRAVLPDGNLPEWRLDVPIKYAGETVNEIGFNSYRRYAPDGGTALTTALLHETYDFWKKAKDEGRYEYEKQALAEQVTRALCKKYPLCEGKIEVADVATPLTYERYTSAYRGSWMSVIEPGDKMKRHTGECESVAGLYFAGHRVMPPGGLPVAAASGRTAAQLVCRQFGAVFKPV